MNEQKVQRGSVVKWASKTSNAEMLREAAGSRDDGNVVGRKVRSRWTAEESGSKGEVIWVFGYAGIYGYVLDAEDGYTYNKGRVELQYAGKGYKKKRGGGGDASKIVIQVTFRLLSYGH